MEAVSVLLYTMVQLVIRLLVEVVAIAAMDMVEEDEVAAAVVAAINQQTVKYT